MKTNLVHGVLLLALTVAGLTLAGCNSTSSPTDRGGDAQANPVSTGASQQTRKKAAPPGTGG